MWPYTAATEIERARRSQVALHFVVLTVAYTCVWFSEIINRFDGLPVIVLLAAPIAIHAFVFGCTDASYDRSRYRTRVVSIALSLSSVALSILVAFIIRIAAERIALALGHQPEARGDADDWNVALPLHTRALFTLLLLVLASHPIALVSLIGTYGGQLFTARRDSRRRRAAVMSNRI